MKLFYSGLTLYALIAIITFGHCYNLHGTKEDRLFATAAELNASSSLLAAMFWPLYWSVHFQTRRP